MITLTIYGVRGEVRQIEASAYGKSLAVHETRGVDFDRVVPDRWTLTHVPTGVAIVHGLSCEDAFTFAKLLENALGERLERMTLANHHELAPIANVVIRRFAQGNHRFLEERSAAA